MKGLFVFLLATAIVQSDPIGPERSSKAVHKSIFDIHQGWNNSNTPRIIGGSEAHLGDFPYHVRLVMELPPLITGSCGGSIIAANWVLTAAHCLYVDVLAVFLGIAVAPPARFLLFTIEAGSVVAGQPAQSRSLYINDAHAHPDYDYSTLMNDIGLLYVTEPFDIASTLNVRPVTLVDYNPDASQNVYVNQYVTASGFGYITNNGPVSSKLLYTKVLRVISFPTCQRQYSGSQLPTTSFGIQDPTDPYSAICSGDSGGPITLQINGEKTQVGIVSYGHVNGCNTACQGATHVTLFVQWIRDTTGITTL